ncbi:cytidylyltransferase domain-containing protein [Allomuricauda sp. CP2A]|mgnify:CR=1 FL=1|jgi:CMP-N-acetylneuraminic acid synthetase|uniref:acylneuraminate cytidylyltransferase family protein n=1 Tax=Allomuricauda sp. CP2A TaxID=1848189 RepID=UPI00082EFD7A|nr:acylneuraminate cytidylyltransferase family protein [Muricauda sp. CP2A]
MSILITICGRGGSKGIPGKNIREICGKPLIAYTIKHAKKIMETFENTDISLSTDDFKIKSVAEMYGLHTKYVRPETLAGDTVGKIDVLRDVLLYEEESRNKKYDFLLDLDITSPLRTIFDITEAMDKLMEKKEAYNIFSVSRPHKNPYFNVVEQSDDGYCSLVKHSNSLSRQTAPKVYDMNASFYIYRRSFFDAGFGAAVTNKSLFYLMEHICFDLDEPLDFDFLEYLITEGKLDIEL